MQPDKEKVIQILQVSSPKGEHYFLYLTSEGDIWRCIDPAADFWEVMPTPIGKPSKDLMKRELHHGSGA